MSGDARRVERLLAEFPGLSTEELTLTDLPFIRMATNNVGSHWYNLGIYFQLPTNFLDEIRGKFRQNADRCLTAVLGEWLKNPSLDPPSWRTVVAAVGSRVGGDNPAEARKIARNYTRFGRVTDFKNLDQVDNRTLTSRDVGPVQGALMEGVADKWLAIGLLLGIPYHRLEACEAEDTLNQRVTRMVTEWLEKRYDTEKFGLPSWRRLVEVIASRAGGSHNYLANQLVKSHPVQAAQPEEDLYPGSSGSRLPGPPKPADALSDADLPTLVTLLRPVAAKWNLLGLQLGIPMSELQIIMGKPGLFASAPMSYLQETLYIWLQQQPPEKEWPTVRKLCDALRGDVMDNDFGLADQVRAALVDRAQT